MVQEARWSEVRSGRGEELWYRNWSKLVMQRLFANCMPAISVGNSRFVQLRLSWGSPCASYMTFSSRRGCQHSR